MRFIALEQHHLRLLRPQDAQAHEATDEALSAPVGQGWTAVVDGLPICCGGIVPVWPGRAYAWALLDRDAGPHMLALTRGIRSLLAGAGWRRLEMAVDAEFLPGKRWAEMLGFRAEALAPKYLPNGHDAWVFVRV